MNQFAVRRKHNILEAKAVLMLEVLVVRNKPPVPKFSDASSTPFLRFLHKGKLTVASSIENPAGC